MGLGGDPSGWAGSPSHSPGHHGLRNRQSLVLQWRHNTPSRKFGSTAGRTTCGSSLMARSTKCLPTSTTTLVGLKSSQTLRIIRTSRKGGQRPATPKKQRSSWRACALVSCARVARAFLSARATRAVKSASIARPQAAAAALAAAMMTHLTSLNFRMHRLHAHLKTQSQGAGQYTSQRQQSSLRRARRSASSRLWLLR